MCVHVCVHTGQLNTGQITGIVVGFILATAVVGLAVFFIMRQRNAAVVNRLFAIFKSDSVSVILVHRKGHIISSLRMLLESIKGWQYIEGAFYPPLFLFCFDFYETMFHAGQKNKQKSFNTGLTILRQSCYDPLHFALLF